MISPALQETIGTELVPASAGWSSRSCISSLSFADLQLPAAFLSEFRRFLAKMTRSCWVARQPMYRKLAVVQPVDGQ